MSSAAGGTGPAAQAALHTAQPATHKPAAHTCRRLRCGEIRLKPMVVAPDRLKMNRFWDQYPKGYLMLINKRWLL
jgi:hypothetical protein